ncbi:MAG: hypothetical protein K8R48_00475 [Alphaproteobacteria bacterium]|nr:hypothetical protein [Alphaproteobacteria bacterium]
MKNFFEKIWRNIFRLTVGIFAVVVLASLLLLSSMCMEDYTFKQQFGEGAEEAARVLVKYGVCPSEKLCRGKGYFFVGPLSGGMAVQIYGTKNQELLAEFSQVFVRKFIETPDMRHLVIKAYAFTTKEAGNRLEMREWQDGPIFKLDMKR